MFKINGQRPTYTQISRLVGASWKKISPQRKAAYEALAIKDKRRYALELVNQKSQQELQTVEPQDELHTENKADASNEALQSVPAVASATTSQDVHVNPPPKLALPFLAANMNYHLPTLPNAYQGIDPNSASFQAMLRQSATHHTSNFPMTSPGMAAQMHLLSA